MQSWADWWKRTIASTDLKWIRLPISLSSCNYSYTHIHVLIDLRCTQGITPSQGRRLLSDITKLSHTDLRSSLSQEEEPVEQSGEEDVSKVTRRTHVSFECHPSVRRSQGWVFTTYLIKSYWILARWPLEAVEGSLREPSRLNWIGSDTWICRRTLVFIVEIYQTQSLTWTWPTVLKCGLLGVT